MPKLLYIVNVDWFFVSHRLPIALAAIRNGYEVHLVCGITDRKQYLEKLGLNVHSLPISRSSLNALEELKNLIRLWNLINTVKPDIIHSVTIKCVIYGGLIGRLCRVSNRVASISGLGFVFIDQSPKTRALRALVKILYRVSLGPTTKAIFQNSDDQSFFIKNKYVEKKNSILVNGSGVDLDVFRYSKEPDTKKTVMFVARLLKDKGVFEFVEAAKIVKREMDVRFILVGDTDSNNPNSITSLELEKMVQDGNIEHWGYRQDIELVIPQAHLISLPSYREGLPKSLIEAAACGRAVITTDVPGCRDAIQPNVTGLLVAVKDPNALAMSILKLLKSDAIRKDFGVAARVFAEDRFNLANVVSQHLKVYQAFGQPEK